MPWDSPGGRAAATFVAAARTPLEFLSLRVGDNRVIASSIEKILAAADIGRASEAARKRGDGEEAKGLGRASRMLLDEAVNALASEAYKYHRVLDARDRANQGGRCAQASRWGNIP